MRSMPRVDSRRLVPGRAGLRRTPSSGMSELAHPGLVLTPPDVRPLLLLDDPGVLVPPIKRALQVDRAVGDDVVGVGEQRQEDGREVTRRDLDLDAARLQLVRRELGKRGALRLAGPYVERRGKALAGLLVDTVGPEGPAGLLDQGLGARDVESVLGHVGVEGPPVSYTHLR